MDSSRTATPAAAEQALRVNGVDLCVETFGALRDPALLLVGGASMPMDWWHDGLCRTLAGAGRFVVRYDHRDTGRSTTYPPGAPGYGFDDLVADAVGLIDRLGVERAHLVGISMGGGIAQRIALDHPDRVETQTLIATSPGLRPGARTDGDLPQMTPALLAHFRDARPEVDWTDRDALIDLVVAGQRRLTGEGAFDATSVRRIAARVVDRSRDLRAAQTNHGVIDPGEPYRSRLGRTRAPTLVVHGTADPLFPLGHAEALAREIPDAVLVRLDAVGHQVPPPASWGTFIPALVWHVRDRVRLGVH